MKKICLYLPIFILLMIAVNSACAQSGAIYTTAGGGASTAEAVPATSASFLNTTGIGVDGAGNVYVADKGRYIIKKVDGGSGLIYTIAGTSGVSGFSGDGGPATAAALSNNIIGMHVTAGGDVYISDNTRVRKISSSTGKITTVAGGGLSTADGVPATTASLSIKHVFVDSMCNIYVGSGKIRKVDALTGIITTIAGGGSSFADGIPATAANMSGNAKGICMDNAGNIYMVADMGDKIRKIDAITGLVATVAGGGSATTDAIPATSLFLNNVQSCRVDGAGNIFIGDWSRGLIRRVDAVTGIANTIAGVYSGGSGVDGTPALVAAVSPYMLWLDPPSGNVFYSDELLGRVRKFTYSPMVPLSVGWGAGSPSYFSDSFYVNIHKQCTGPQLTLRTHSNHTGMTIRSDFGNGTRDTSIVNSSWTGMGGYALKNAVYAVPGTYTIKHVLCNAGVPVDSFMYSYAHVFCSEMSVRFYNDVDVNCIKGATDPFLTRSTVTEIDSNGVPVDTMVATSGFSYMAFGNPGDIYTFRLLSVPTALSPFCPASGIFYDTLFAGVNISTPRYAAVSCISPAFLDLEVVSLMPDTRPIVQHGTIYVRNNHCISTDASLTLHFSPKYVYSGGCYPAPVSSTATSITWNFTDVNIIDGSSRWISYNLSHNSAVPFPIDGDTVHQVVSVTGTTAGDINIANNIVIRVDTVRTSLDPNNIEVTPSCFDNDTTFHFIVHFENIGSAPAENIYVMDTLSSYFDPSTINIEMSTHAMFTSKQQVNGKTIFKFDFPNINLADSSDHENREGAFMYTIKNKPGMVMGESALSRVGIYFDFNDVLMTNTAQNIKGCPVVPVPVAGINSPMDSSAATLHPNPATDELTITADPASFNSLTITSAIGQQVWQQSIGQSQVKVNVKELAAGVYYVTLKGGQGIKALKFVKW